MIDLWSYFHADVSFVQVCLETDFLPNLARGRVGVLSQISPQLFIILFPQIHFELDTAIVTGAPIMLLLMVICLSRMKASQPQLMVSCHPA